jgi:hypothetical protein
MICSGVNCGGMLVFRPTGSNDCTPEDCALADQFDPKLHHVVAPRRFATRHKYLLPL